MNKKALLCIIALTYCHLSLSMLIKQLRHLPKHARAVRSKHIKLIRDIFKNNPVVKNIQGTLDYDDRDPLDVYDYYEEGLKDIYFRNENIIKILREDIKDMQKQRIKETQKIKKEINTLKKQQNLAVLGLSGSIDHIYTIEKELHTMFGVKDTE
ncbi:MAG TPA: hypothetical protein VKU36_01615 [Candidatus Babeliales bacterium]|nr:hypothetical protein [Candidatus Babeliales bacterium]